MRKAVCAAALLMILAGRLPAQEAPSVTQGKPFFYICLEFDKPHDYIYEAVSLFIQEVRCQELLPKVQGDVFGIFFDFSLLGEEVKPFWGIGVRVQEDTVVYPPLKKDIFDYEKIATAVHKGPFETVANTLNLLLSHIEQERWRVAGPPVETWTGDPGTDKPEDLRTEIIIPVRKKDM